MSFAALVASLMLVCAVFPGVLLGIEERYTWVLSRVAARMSEGALDDQTAFRRIRRGEVINPRTSVRIFASGGFLFAVLSRAFKPETQWLPSLLILVFAIVVVAVAPRADYSLLARVIALALGALCVIAIL
jgi:hypothetical protein